MHCTSTELGFSFLFFGFEGGGGRGQAGAGEGVMNLTPIVTRNETRVLDLFLLYEFD